MKRQVFSYSWVFERFLFCFIFEKASSSLPMLFVNIGKRSSRTLRSSRLQMFFKVGALKNFSMFTNNTCVESLFDKAGALKACIFIKKEIPTQVFSCEYSKILKNSFLVVHYTFTWWYNSLDVFGYKIDVFHISCTTCFLYRLQHMIELLKTRDNYRTLATAPANLLWKMCI